MKLFLQNLFQLVLSPGNGWEDIAKTDSRADVIAVRGFYPLIAVTALSIFVEMLYKTGCSFIGELLKAVLVFMMYFLSYFIGTFILSVFIGPMLNGKTNENRIKTFVIYSLGLLSLISLLVNCLPITTVVLFFLPIYVAIIMWKGTAYMEVAHGSEGQFMLVAIPGVIVPPYLIYFLFSLIIPS